MRTTRILALRRSWRLDLAGPAGSPSGRSARGRPTRRSTTVAYSSLVGARIKRKEDPRLITGAGSYVGDIKLPGLQHVAFVRSPYPHARIGDIDTSAALAIPGVTAVITGADLVEVIEPMPM